MPTINGRACVANGRNLLTGTGNHTVTGTGAWNQGYLSNETADDFLTLFKGLEGQTVTISVDYKYSGFVAGSSSSRLGWETSITSDSTLYFGAWISPDYSHNDSGSGRISYTFVVPKNITSVGGGRGYVQFHGSGTGTLSHLKLEKGSVATPWAPVPVDKVFSNGRQVYGRNLLINTETMTGAMWYTPGNILTTEKLNGCNVETEIGDWKSARYLFDDLTNRNVINTTDDFVFSAMLRVDPTLKDNPALIEFFSSATTKNSALIGNIKDYADGEWHQVSVAFKFLTTLVGDEDVDKYTQSLRFELGNSNGATVYWAQRKLEKGSVATPWTPAPEDVGVK